jgi:hypothetical protein
LHSIAWKDTIGPAGLRAFGVFFHILFHSCARSI